MVMKGKGAKKIFTVLLSSSMLLSVTPQAFANPVGALSQTVSYKAQAAAVTIKTIDAGNGTIAVGLSALPTKAPKLEDFKFTRQINGKSASALKATDMVWDAKTKTAFFTFKAISATSAKQTVIVNAEYQGSKLSAKPFTIAAKGADVDKLEISANAADSILILDSKTDAELTLTAVAKDEDGNVVTGKRVKWETADKAIASVDRSGVVTAVAEGSTTITASYGDVKATFKVTVKADAPGVSSVSATNGSITAVFNTAPKAEPKLKDFTLTREINGKKATTLRATGFTWNKESKTAVFTFKEIAATKEKQEVVIGVTYEKEQVFADAFTIAKKDAQVKEIELINLSADAELAVNSSDDAELKLSAVAKDEEGNQIAGKKVTWKSDDSKVVTVDKDGSVKAVGAGKAKITATIDKVSANIEVTVVAAKPEISLSASTLSESSANDGSVAGTQVVTLVNGKFASDISAADVTVSNLPAGLGVSVARISDTQLGISFTGRAVKHEAANSVSGLSVTVAKGKVEGAKENLTAGSFGIVFADAVVVPVPTAATIAATPGTLTEAGANDGSLTSGVITVTATNGTFAADIAKSDVTVTGLPSGMDYTVTYVDATHITVTLTGQATDHENADDTNVSVTVAQAKVTGATANVSTGNVAIDFNDAAAAATIAATPGT
ncbi:hypothetical protein EDM56_12925, partial [Brevibacillus fluminis]